jgi:hypothetical protein
MSGVKGRLECIPQPKASVWIKGFNDSRSQVDVQGQNEDGKKEYYVRTMPDNLVLLSANDYVQGGAAILLPRSGVVIRFNSRNEEEQFMNFVRSFSVVKKLQVRNRTYEVVKTEVAYSVNHVQTEEAMSNTATRYFNSHINISTGEERVLAMLLRGLTYRDLYGKEQFS